MEVKVEVKMEVKRYAQDVSIVNWYRPFLLPFLLPLLLPNYHFSFIIYHLAQRPAPPRSFHTGFISTFSKSMPSSIFFASASVISVSFR